MAEGCTEENSRGAGSVLDVAQPRLAEGEDLEDQVNELIALKAIYENEDIEICEHENSQRDLPGGIFNIPIFPPQPFNVKITKDLAGIKRLAFWRLGRHAEAVRGRGRRERQLLKTDEIYEKAREKMESNRGGGSVSGDESEKAAPEEPKLYPVKRLPPVTLTFAFPHDYPTTSPPQFTLSCCWLDKNSLTKLCEKLDSIWEQYQGTPVVMNWVCFLQEELVEHLGLTSPYDLGRVLTHVFTHPAKSSYPEHYPPPLKKKPFDQRGIQTFSNIDEVLPKVLDFNLITCEVCFEEQAGEKFLRLVSCSDHTLCKSCMGGWFEEQIKEGAVSDLTCPGYKCDKSVLPTEVASVVSPELYQRYDRLLLKNAFDAMRDVSHCPRPFCQFPVVMDDNLGLCPKCKHAFCGRCQNTYHGHTPCKLKADMFSTICKEYETSNASRKQELEVRYGKQVIQRALEETRSERWLESNSKQCPNCSTFIQKKDGCNKMTCTKCRAFFCWLCQQELSRSNPYAHYQHPTSPCSNRLFEGVEIDDDDFPDADLFFSSDDDDDNEDSSSDDEIDFANL
ncbi:E3 ubiquitin-protein ligase RNF14 isoform X2 [Aplysia californica]|uniref:RBR-type E3 ubiquitin transferase n=1 Tax=Aplysia californica TaxID=6500 RepID=A0ABM0JMZ8_APLCA|nr:E3 ubiquitin-protein ligase RNF14 isoform X2 [Aplysia californica]